MNQADETGRGAHRRTIWTIMADEPCHATDRANIKASTFKNKPWHWQCFGAIGMA